MPQTLPKECIKATRILQSFVNDGKGGLDGVIPRHVLERAWGFAFLSVLKAGFVVSARAGSGLVIARLDDDTWSAPSAIGTAGMGFGGQAGAEVTDFLFVLNSRSAVRTFMSAGSITLGGSLSVALGPLGRTGEAAGSLNSNGKVAAIYSYSKTKGIFGGVSIEGSVIVERQDANCLAYDSNVTAQMLLSGVVPVPQWADGLIQAISNITGQSVGSKWVRERGLDSPIEYAFGGIGSPGSVTKKKSPKGEFPPKSWGTPKNDGSYFDAWENNDNQTKQRAQNNDAILVDTSTPASPGGSKYRPFSGMTSPFDTTNADLDIRISTDKMSSPFDTSVLKRSNSGAQRPKATRTESETSLKMRSRAAQLSSQLESDVSAISSRFSLLRGPSTPNVTPAPQNSLIDFDHDDSMVAHNSPPRTDPNLPFHLQEVHVDLDKTNVSLPPAAMASQIRPSVLRKSSKKYDTDSDEEQIPTHKRAPSQRFKAALKEPLAGEGIGRAIVRFDFDAAEPDDLTIRKGEIILILEKSASVNDWWRGQIGDRVGNFPANFVEVVGPNTPSFGMDPFDM
ncbi:hypothetical protein FRC20_010991 [Serendipita sp. 405]|nr:hypothetical protein FRC20_010991 [Serendipita sp. 405]